MLVDWDRPAGERIRSIEVGGAPLEDARVYAVAMNSYLPGLTDEYPAFADMGLVAEWGTCEEALRALVAADGREQLVDELTGTVSYADPDTGHPDAGDEDTPLVPLEPAEPVDGTGGAADDGATAGDLPRTGDAGTLTVSIVAGLGALCAGAGAGLAWRRPRAPGAGVRPRAPLRTARVRARAPGAVAHRLRDPSPSLATRIIRPPCGGAHPVSRRCSFWPAQRPHPARQSSEIAGIRTNPSR